MDGEDCRSRIEAAAPVSWAKDATSELATLAFFLGRTALTNVETGAVSFRLVALRILPEVDFFRGGSGDSDISLLGRGNLRQVVKVRDRQKKSTIVIRHAFQLYSYSSAYCSDNSAAANPSKPLERVRVAARVQKY